MPKTSEREQLLCDLEGVMKYSKLTDLICESDSTSEDDESSSSDEEELSTYSLAAGLHLEINQQRFLKKRKRLPKSRDYVHNYFVDQSATNFRNITRVTHETFYHILSLIENDVVFLNHSTNKQHPTHWQLACALDRLGNDGQGVSHAHSKLIWGIGQGTVHLYTRRVLSALCNLKSQYIRWPNAEVRRQISGRLARKGFKDCVGFVDGTTIPLYKKPAIHGNVFMDRKKCYSVNAQVVCDDMYRVTCFITGFPGSYGDARVYSSSSLFLRADEAFSINEYLLTDSGYGASKTIVPAYKDNQRDCLADRHERRKIERFNTYLAKARIVNEHTIGILKSWWTCLRGMRIDIHEDDHMRRFVEQATACIVLHNICLNHDPWEEEIDVTQATNAEDREREGVVQRSALSVGQKKRWSVRNACLSFHDRQ